jgi:hypothetical protein
VSATLSLLEAPVSAALAAALGWDAPPRAAVLTAQLLELGRLHATCPPPPSELCQPPLGGSGPTDSEEGAAAEGAPAEGAAAAEGAPERSAAAASSPAATTAAEREALAAALDGGVAGLYAALTAALGGHEAELVAMSLEGRPGAALVWSGRQVRAGSGMAGGREGMAGKLGGSWRKRGVVGGCRRRRACAPGCPVAQAAARWGGGFVPAAAAALRSDGGGDFAPWLWALPPPLHRFDGLLALMGVADRWAARGRLRTRASEPWAGRALSPQRRPPPSQPYTLLHAPPDPTTRPAVPPCAASAPAPTRSAWPRWRRRRRAGRWATRRWRRRWRWRTARPRRWPRAAVAGGPPCTL